MDRTPSERKAHYAAIDRIVSRWLSGELSTTQKQEAIAAENLFFHGREKRSQVTGEVLTVAKGSASHVPAAPAAPDPDPWGEDDDEGLRWDQK